MQMIRHNYIANYFYIFILQVFKPFVDTIVTFSDFKK